MTLLPQPKSITSAAGVCRIDAQTADDIMKRRFGDLSNGGQLQFRQDASVPEQGSRICIRPGKLEIAASSPPGAWWGIITLRQLLLQHPEGSLPGMDIIDEPRFPVRGFHLDISRNRVPSMDTLQELVDLLSLLKYNHLQLYTEHTFAYREHRRVWEHASPLTAEEIRFLDGCCRRRGIELTANQNCFGHFERWLQFPQYRHLAETPEGFTDPWGFRRPVGSSLSPAAPEAPGFIRSLLEELLPNFTGRQVNIGGDEPWELGQGKSRDLCRRYGTGRVYLDFITKLCGIVRELGGEPLIYGDIITAYPELAGELPDDVTVIDWGYEADHPFAEETALFLQHRQPMYVCCGTSVWNSLAGRWTNALKNVKRAAAEAARADAGGLLVSEWGDNGHLQQHSCMVPPLLCGAAAAWNPDSLEDLDLASCIEWLLPMGMNSREFFLLTALADAYLLEPRRLHNATVLGALMIDQTVPFYRKQLTSCRGSDVTELHHRVAEIRREIELLPESLCRDEILLTARMMEFSCSFGRYHYGMEGRGIPPADPRRWQQITEEFSRLWHLRSRPGGWGETREYLERTARLLSENHRSSI